MAGPTNGGAQRLGLGGWFSGALDAVEQERAAAEAAGREAYERAIRTGEDVQARTRAELIALGRSKLAQDAVRVAQQTARSVGNPNGWHEGLMQADAAARGLANTVTLGGADHLAAFGDATGDGAPVSSLMQRYRTNLQDQRARDAYDGQHRAAAQLAGQVAGVGVAFVGGAEEGAAWARGLDKVEKGKLGEYMSRVKSGLQGDRWVEQRVARRLGSGKITYVDGITRRGRWVESKFGPKARLSPNQTQAMREQGPNYRVDRWGPQHVGYWEGGVQGGIAGVGAAIDDDR